ncbi:MAG: NADH-quinone oxidoreductase subunit C [Mycobacteriales bacterium]
MSPSTGPAGIDLVARLSAVLPDARVTSSYDVVTADVERGQWTHAVAACRDDAALDGTFFDVLLAVDEHPDGFDVVVRLWSVRARHGFHLRTRCPRSDPRVPTLTAVFAGAAWHEREAAEMFGLTFDGRPAHLPLLLPDGFDGHPLRKERVLAARMQPWPGAVDPADAGPGRPAGRRRLLPPGAPPPVPPGEPLP